jgi:catechol 2,3-dioxygenase-like lactoylglutathione lyase family enzyme
VRRLVLIGIGAALTASIHAQGPAQAPPGDITGVGNFSHIVADIDRALAFYRDVLGLEVTANQPFSPNPAIMRLGNTPGAQSRFVALAVPESALGVELIEYKDIDRRVQRPKFVDPGAANIALRVRDLAPILAKLPGSGATVITAGGKPAAIGNSQYLFLQDPDGFVVELVQTVPASVTPASVTPASVTPAAGGPAPTGGGNVLGAGSFELTVGDLDQTVRFYREMLGLEMSAPAAWNDNPLMAGTAGAPGASFRQSRVTIPGSTTTFTLIEFRNIARTPLAGRVQDPGTAILQVRVRDVDALTKKLRAAGVPIITADGAPVEIRPGLKIVLVKDPNNLIIELMQAG